MSLAARCLLLVSELPPGFLPLKAVDAGGGLLEEVVVHRRDGGVEGVC